MASDAVRRYLTSAEIAKHGGAITRAAARRAGAWGAHGWGFAGRSPRIRLVMKVDRKRTQPEHPIDTIPLPRALGGRLKVAVAPSYRDLDDATAPTTGTSGALTAVRELLAPGAPILVGSAGAREHAGAAGVLVIGGRLHLLTCGHAFHFDDDAVFAPGIAEPLAELTTSYFGSFAPLDAAVCRLTDEGIDALRQSTTAPTWFPTAHRPAPSDNDRPAVFWPTHTTAGAFEDDVRFFSACDTSLFPAGPTCGFIEMPFPAQGGDSGSILAKDDQLYGLCSGRVGNSTALFTPITTVVDRLKADHSGDVQIWNPVDGAHLLS